MVEDELQQVKWLEVLLQWCCRHRLEILQRWKRWSCKVDCYGGYWLEQWLMVAVLEVKAGPLEVLS